MCMFTSRLWSSLSCCWSVKVCGTTTCILVVLLMVGLGLPWKPHHVTSTAPVHHRLIRSQWFRRSSSPGCRTLDGSAWSAGPGTECCRRAYGARTARASSGCPFGRRCRGSNCTWMVSGLERETEQENIILLSLRLGSLGVLTLFGDV